MSYLTGLPYQFGVFDEERTILWRTEWAYQRRGVHLRPSAFTNSWPGTRIGSGDPTAPLAVFGLDCCQGEAWGPWELGVGGKATPVFLSGRTLNSSGVPIAGVTLQGFRTSDNLFVGQTISDANGNYSLGSPYPSVAHYLVAYLPGSPDVLGTTVNTLVPS